MTSATAEMEPELENRAGTEASESEMPSYDDINTPVVLMVGLISVIVTVCTIFFVQGLYYQWQNGYIRERSYDVVNKSVKDIVEQQKKLLEGDSEKGIKPVDVAIGEIVAEFGNK